VIELWVSPQLQDRARRAATRTGHRQPDPQSQARVEQQAGERMPGPLGLQRPRAHQAEPELEAG
jgi:hypothetical protein